MPLLSVQTMIKSSIWKRVTAYLKVHSHRPLQRGGWCVVERHHGADVPITAHLTVRFFFVNKMYWNVTQWHFTKFYWPPCSARRWIATLFWKKVWLPILLFSVHHCNVVVWTSQVGNRVFCPIFWWHCNRIATQCSPATLGVYVTLTQVQNVIYCSLPVLGYGGCIRFL